MDDKITIALSRTHAALLLDNLDRRLHALAEAGKDEAAGPDILARMTCEKEGLATVMFALELALKTAPQSECAQ